MKRILWSAASLASTVLTVTVRTALFGVALALLIALFGFKAVGAVDRRAELLFAVEPSSIPWAAGTFVLIGVAAWYLGSHAVTRFREYGAAQAYAADDAEYAVSPLRPGFWRTMGNALMPLVATALVGATVLLTAGWFFEQGRDRVEGATITFEYGTVQATLFSDGSAQCHLGMDELPCEFAYRDDERFNELLGADSSWAVSFGDLYDDGGNFVFAWTHAGIFTVGNFGDMRATDD